jgi:hypothetical protein
LGLVHELHKKSNQPLRPDLAAEFAAKAEADADDKSIALELPNRHLPPPDLVGDSGKGRDGGPDPLANQLAPDADRIDVALVVQPEVRGSRCLTQHAPAHTLFSEEDQVGGKHFAKRDRRCPGGDRARRADVNDPILDQVGDLSRLGRFKAIADDDIELAGVKPLRQVRCPAINDL